MSQHRYSARTEIFAEDDAAEAFYEISSGSIMLFKIMQQGRRQILDVASEGEFFGLAAHATYGYCAQALTNAYLKRHDRETLQQSADLRAKVTSFLLSHDAAQRSHMLLLGKSSAMERVAGLFLEDRWSQKCAHLSLNEIADYLGLRAETVSRQMSVMHKAGLVKRSRWGSYVVHDEDALRKAASA